MNCSCCGNLREDTDLNYSFCDSCRVQLPPSLKSDAPGSLREQVEEALVRLVATEQNAALSAKWEALLGDIRK